MQLLGSCLLVQGGVSPPSTGRQFIWTQVTMGLLKREETRNFKLHSKSEDEDLSHTGMGGRKDSHIALDSWGKRWKWKQRTRREEKKNEK